MITAAQVITLAYNRTIKAGQLLESQITAAQFDFIRPALGENFYNYVNQNISDFDTLDDDITEGDGRITTGKKLMTDLLRPALAYYVKYLSANDVLNDISDRGGFNLQAENASVMSSSEKQNWKETALKTANILSEQMVDYVKKQHNNNVTKYALFNNFAGVSVEKKIIGGILCESVKEKLGLESCSTATTTTSSDILTREDTAIVTAWYFIVPADYMLHTLNVSHNDSSLADYTFRVGTTQHGTELISDFIGIVPLSGGSTELPYIIHETYTVETYIYIEITGTGIASMNAQLLKQ